MQYNDDPPDGEADLPHGARYVPAYSADEIEGGPLLRPNQVEAITTLDLKTIDRLVARDRFPAPLQLSDRRRAWKRRDLRAWLDDPLGWVNF